MRILLVSHHAPPHIGGVETLVDTEARGLAAAGHQVTWVTSRAAGVGSVPDYPESVQVVRVPAWHLMERWFGIAYPIFSLRLLWVLWREAGRADLVHAHGFLFQNSWLALIVGWLRGRPRILTDHGGIHHYRSRIGTLVMRLAVETVGRNSARLATRLVAYNSRVGKLLVRLAGRPEKLLFLANPVDRALFHPLDEQARQQIRKRLGWAAQRPKVLFVGRLVADKGIHRLAQAADPRFDLVFCGPAEPATLTAIVREGIEYLPPRPRAELAEIYQAADLFVLPSWNEGFPVVIQEAIACGLPVVTCYDEGYEPYRRLPQLTFCDGDPAGIRQAILAVLDRSQPFDGLVADELFPDMGQWITRLLSGIVPDQPQNANSVGCSGSAS